MSLCVERLEFSYRNKKILEDVSFRAENGNLLCLLGCNGAGKSTLFRCILGLLPFDAGSVRLDGEDVLSLSYRERAKKIAYIPQSQPSVFNYSVMDLVLMGTTPQLGGFSCPGQMQTKRAEEALGLLGIEELAGRSYARLSGGERQLVLIARAVAQRAKMLLMDEPCSGLDYGNQVRVMERIKELSGQGYLILMSTHSPGQVYLYADRVLVLMNGKIRCGGPPDEVLDAEMLKTVYGIPVSLERVNGVPVCIPENRRTGGNEHVGTV
ncbi:ABC transporter ATP-binding protein [Caproicibacter sp.]|uniref:ABC transporter ATP-binding protein n=1 Tax=Caproicibacter sp. TaxID=2814884 RepID=UPI0039898C14